MRYSIGRLMFLVAICAGNFFLLAKIGGNPRDYGIPAEFGELILLGALPMADVLAVRALVRPRGRRPFDHFLLGGCCSLLLYLAVASTAGGAIKKAILGVMYVLTPLRTGGLFDIIPRIGLAVLLNVGPQLAVAALIARTLRARRGPDTARAMPGPRSAD